MRPDVGTSVTQEAVTRLTRSRPAAIARIKFAVMFRPWISQAVDCRSESLAPPLPRLTALARSILSPCAHALLIPNKRGLRCAPKIGSADRYLA